MSDPNHIYRALLGACGWTGENAIRHKGILYRVMLSADGKHSVTRAGVRVPRGTIVWRDVVALAEAKRDE